MLEKTPYVIYECSSCDQGKKYPCTLLVPCMNSDGEVEEPWIPKENCVFGLVKDQSQMLIKAEWKKTELTVGNEVCPECLSPAFIKDRFDDDTGNVIDIAKCKTCGDEYSMAFFASIYRFKKQVIEK